MTKKSQLFWIDILLLVVLIVTILTFSLDLFTHSGIHVSLGLSLCAVAVLHLGLHWKWIKNTIQRFRNLSESGRSNALHNFRLFLTYISCGSIGLIARAIPISSKHHMALGFIHGGFAVLLVVFQIKHIRRHWNWIKAMAS